MIGLDALRRLKERLQLKTDYRELFSSERGQRVLEHMAKVGFVTSPLGSPIEGEMREREGMRRMVLSIMAMCNKPETDVTNLIRQQQEQESQHEE